MLCRCDVGKEKVVLNKCLLVVRCPLCKAESRIWIGHSEDEDAQNKSIEQIRKNDIVFAM